MRKAIALLGLLAALGLTACDDTTTAPRDITPPAAPRGLFSVTGDGQVSLFWTDNTESDLAGYRIYQAPCASGTSCPFDRIGSTTATQFVAGSLANGVTRYYAVSAIDRAGNESALSELDVFDTPRPAGSGVINNFVNGTAGAGWDFSAFGSRSSNDALTDMFYGYNGSVRQMFVPDLATNIQDAGYAGSLDAVDFAPNAGWSPTGSVELIIGHCYIVWTRDDRYAKFRVTSISNATVSFDWAYQTAAGNRELKAKPSLENNAPRPLVWIQR
ncbi:MAG: hypothetical protein K8R56_05675 [Candidatus Eisenbacteria bacterium]|nr:hypothetical protein [Candidatus Eisenbacteria bacterium]